ncbi:MAG: host attachment protein [Gammaproteobacteria bacterium]|nr:host attachment protein [Gammaproteobacteria bacterium]
MKTRWAVIANSSRARIFARVIGAGAWQDIQDLADKHAVDAPEAGRESRAPKDPSAEPEGTCLLSRLTAELKAARKRGDYEELILVMPETLQKSLRSALDANTRKLIIASTVDELPINSLTRLRKELAKRW